MRVVMTMVVLVLVLLMAAMPIFSQAMDIHQMRQIAAKNNVTCILVFGDSSVDPGNNNRIPLAPKSNFPPYGKDLFRGHPTGRFTNGRLATDFIAEAFGYTNIIRGFLDSNMEKVDLLHGVSFASAGSGYDELTTNLSYLRHYKIHLRELVGEVKAEEIIRNAIFVISMGTNDFLQNYFTETTRRKQFTVDQYQNYLISSMFRAVKAMHYLGARRLAIVGVPPFGCMPIVETLDDESQCDDEYNQVAFSFNSKIKQTLVTLKATLGIQNAYIDIYSVIASAIKKTQDIRFQGDVERVLWDGAGRIRRYMQRYEYVC
ncbi:GDSL-like Lipase/Acylhydrolase superfamily protein [Actinidia rufa]|uniref:GDSL-like Lipase/Acylhydrolase superfamily protein n=1 Tax=Actinidia rufa TaxID=165716 RepID=A0A7J0F0C0_9ERIC|nr:GDSL-like Lipase/Acylhydrolase superfamily protein [Actinidia rufa]